MAGADWPCCQRERTGGINRTGPPVGPRFGATSTPRHPHSLPDPRPDRPRSANLARTWREPGANLARTWADFWSRLRAESGFWLPEGASGARTRKPHPALPRGVGPKGRRQGAGGGSLARTRRGWRDGLKRLARTRDVAHTPGTTAWTTILVSQWVQAKAFTPNTRCRAAWDRLRPASSRGPRPSTGGRACSRAW